ncbi:DUF7521 family protein [Natronomonas marina]|uniref:DUF7521 family protein n=1 Tax=Natronomonas marina TaxID=2961939 RepID=UPI0020CA19E6|nr:hypothetical protein [Natronomonas marina]
MAGLQVWSGSAPPEWLAAFSQATDVLAALLGIFVAYQAYRGYRRNGSRPMLFIAVGFVLALAVPFLLLLAFLALPFVGRTVATVLTGTSQVVGLLAIVYALRMPA